MTVQLYIIHFLIIQVHFHVQPGDNIDKFILYKSQKKCW